MIDAEFDFDQRAAIRRAESEQVMRFVAAGVVRRDNAVLLLRRREDDFMPGIFELPSGRVEVGESLLQAAAREVMEETGLSVVRFLSFLGTFDYLSRGRQLTRQFSFLVATSEAAIRLAEHTEYRWVQAHELADLQATSDTKRIVEVALLRGKRA